ncbi:MAG: hypothetical protein N0C88_20575 [Candidatus Thiodiazotropha lotti]|uniref:Uncharacterized protein n=1 Tax=Candidatus Thiodiazotropha lotti TaxID=2792787 RepID=A0A9E4N273_9GAMM|nr:hypothetical protein [Candidatus Thiodiazotropha lotti]ODC00461.1 hypothetical protein A3197_08980 [Candidatus Thiodiazotropha endoloripes]MCG7986166.1 hypothetical protein [Candidatus Thiodiazotropha lotti]MCG8013149.1 hypothetical protein [Candidatus Thiodiazotropha lotti]MCW4205701.1 hypothetical protein [Candidatus Thiodiazotropha lotti]
MKLLLFAGSALFLGVLYYWLFRAPDGVLFLAYLPERTPITDDSMLQSLIGWLPTFIHVFAFSIVTALVLGVHYACFSCCLWGSVNAVFEAGQALPDSILDHLPELLNLQDYLKTGTFSLMDLAACLLGAAGAWLLLGYFHTTEQLSEDSSVH